MFCLVADCYNHSSICWLGLCKGERNWLGLGRSHLALQYCLLYSTWCHEVCHPLCIEWQGLGKHARKQGMYLLMSFLFLMVKIFMTLIWIDCFKMCHRLPSPPRKTTVRRRGKLNGLMLREPCMDFNHQKLLAFSMRRTVIENSLRLLSRPREELKLQGKNYYRNNE